MLSGHTMNSAFVNTTATPNVHVSGKRSVATILDMVFLSIFLAVVNATFGVMQITSGTAPQLGTMTYYSTTVAVNWWWTLAATIGYFLVQEVLFSTTLGKSILGLHIISSNQPGSTHITPGAAILRNLLRPVDALPFFYLLGALIIGCSSRRQRLGDLVAHTIVVDKYTTAGPAYPRRHRGWSLLIALGLVINFVAFCLYFDYYQHPPLAIQGMYNTHRLLLNTTISAYTLGTPTWGENVDRHPGAAVTYPIQYFSVENGKGHQCQGELTLHWAGFLNGWELSSMTSQCSP